MGHKNRGRKPKEVVKVLEGEAKAKANVTEPDSQEANDLHQLHPMTEEAQQELRAAGVEYAIEIELAHAGYWSEGNLAELSPTDPEFLIATTKDWKQRKAMREQGAPRGRIPEHLSPCERMERKRVPKYLLILAISYSSRTTRNMILSPNLATSLK